MRCQQFYFSGNLALTLKIAVKTQKKMARGQKSFKHKNNTAPVSDDEIYMMVMLYTYQHKSLDYLARKFNVSYFDAKEIIIRSRFGGACG